MRRLLAVILATVVTTVGCTVFPPLSSWKGTKQLGASGKTTYGTSVACDRTNNIILAGYGDAPLGGNTVTGGTDLFVTKLDINGTTQWLRQLGAASVTTTVTGVAVDVSLNVIVAGFVNGGLDGNTATGSNDMFVTQYNGSGQKLWTRQLGVASKLTEGRAVAVDASGNIFVAGGTGGNLDGNTLTGTRDLFLTKYNTSGVRLWTRQLGVATFITEAFGVATDTTGNIYLTGQTNGGLDGNVLIGTQDLFLVKYDTNGAKLLTRQLGVLSKATYAVSVATDVTGNAFIAGATNGNLDGITLTGTVDSVLTKYDANGNRQWTRLLGVSGASTSAKHVAVDGTAPIVTGISNGGVDGNTLTGTTDFYLTKYDGAGSRQFTRQLGVASKATTSQGVAVDPTSNVFVGGYTQGGLNGNTLVGLTDAFLAKYDSVGNLR